MLVLSRKLNEQIRIDERVTVTILRVKGNSVRIGIEAPKEVRVVRGELPPLEKVDEPTSPLSRKLPRLAKIDSDPKPRVTGDHRQKSDPPASHPDRWTVASMRDRTKGDRDKNSSNRSSHRKNPVLG